MWIRRRCRGLCCGWRRMSLSQARGRQWRLRYVCVCLFVFPFFLAASSLETRKFVHSHVFEPRGRGYDAAIHGMLTTFVSMRSSQYVRLCHRHDTHGRLWLPSRRAHTTFQAFRMLVKIDACELIGAIGALRRLRRVLGATRARMALCARERERGGICKVYSHTYAQAHARYIRQACAAQVMGVSRPCGVCSPWTACPWHRCGLDTTFCRTPRSLSEAHASWFASAALPAPHEGARTPALGLIRRSQDAGITSDCAQLAQAAPSVLQPQGRAERAYLAARVWLVENAGAVARYAGIGMRSSRGPSRATVRGSIPALELCRRRTSGRSACAYRQTNYS